MGATYAVNRMNYDARIDVNEERDGLMPDLQGDLAGGEDGTSKRTMWIVGGLAVAVLIALWFVMHRGDGDSLAEGGAAQVPTVSVTEPGKSAIAGRITATGNIGARREMPVGSVGEGGEVVSVLVDAGDWVRDGQVLAVVDRSVQSQQAASLAAQVDVAEADASLAQSNLDRALKLVDRGFISRADVDRLTATRDAANARVKVARAQFAETKARNQRLNIVAPAAGLVLERNVEPGQVVSGGSGVLFRVAKGGEMEMRARLSEADLAKLSVGLPATVTPVGTARSFRGQVWQIAPVIDAQDRQGDARIALSYAPELRPGGFATAEIVAGGVVAPRLPESAILSDEKGSFVYVVGKDDKVQRRSVKTGTVTADGIAIVEGLGGNERVVLRAGGFLNAGDKVKPVVAKAE